jgi:hypothetical protein
MTATDQFTVLSGGPSAEERDARLEAGADELANGKGRTSFVRRDHFLLVVAAALMVLGVCVILIGWAGAAHATVVEGQIPYLISGGLLGVALATIGALTLFTHWLTVGIRENRAHEAARRRDHVELVEAIKALAPNATQEDTKNGRSGSNRPQRQVRRTSSGS